MIARRLNDTGLRAFREFIDRLAVAGNAATPIHLLTEPETSEALAFEAELDLGPCESRHELGQHLLNALDTFDMQPYLRDEGFWSWLALAYFDQLCPADGNGKRKPAKHYNYVLSSNYKHRSRHAIRTSYMLVKKYGDTAKFLLCNPLYKRGELTEQIAARQFFIECEGVIGAASSLYFDPNQDWFKRGSTSGKRKGNVRRFIAYLRQIELTYDLYTIEAQDLVGMLPDEFDAFRIAS